MSCYSDYDHENLHFFLLNAVRETVYLYTKTDKKAILQKVRSIIYQRMVTGNLK